MFEYGGTCAGSHSASFWPSGKAFPGARRLGETGNMADYLERYRRGECEQVWRELVALGGRIREPQLFAQAKSVAHETMTRARANIELLVPRLKSLGFQFAHSERVFVPADDDFRSFVSDIERRAGPLPLSLRAWCDVVGEVNFVGSHPKLSTYYPSHDVPKHAEDFLAAFAKHGGPAVHPGNAVLQSLDITGCLLNDVVQRIQSGRGQSRSPEAAAGLRACMEIVGALQRPVAVAGPEIDSDPLVVEPYFGDLEDNQDEDESEGDADESHAVIIAPDPVHKTNQSGGSPYCIRIPDPAADAALEGEEDYGTFVEYLRTCFQWGGFPGLRTVANLPRDELAYLTEGLSPL